MVYNMKYDITFMFQKHPFLICVQAIRNLSTIAEKLQGGGDNGTGLVLPSDVVIRGNLTVDKDSNIKGSGNFGEKGNVVPSKNWSSSFVDVWWV